MTDTPLLTTSDAANGSPIRKTILNIGCGSVRDPRLEANFPAAEWREIRLDINPAVAPDIVASVTDMSVIGDASFDALWSSQQSGTPQRP